MIRGLYNAASGLVSGMRQQEVVAESVANLNTPGFKTERASQLSFVGMLAARVGPGPAPVPLRTTRLLGVAGGGAYLGERLTVLDEGSARATQRPLDTMLRGDGFFTLDTDDGTRYTRDGHFLMDEQGRLTTGRGDLVLGEGGAPITLGDDVAALRIAPDGRVLVRRVPTGATIDPAAPPPEELVATLAVVSLPPEGLLRDADSRFLLAPGFAAGTVELGTETVVDQGVLEEANVDVGRLATQLLSYSRSYNASQHVFTTINEGLEQTVREIGRVG
jgi:flagellar basal-body rod protein FlgF